MRELKKEELIRIINTAFAHLLKDINYKETKARYEQAKEEIVALIKIGRLEVTEEWIIKRAEETAADYPDVAFPNLITIFKGLLTEAGVSITVDPHGKSGKE